MRPARLTAALRGKCDARLQKALADRTMERVGPSCAAARELIPDSSVDPASVAGAHDLMAEEYDDLHDVWYPWLYCQIHALVAAHLFAHAGARGRMTAFDAGCGTGFQSFLLARAGYRVTGVDVSAELLKVAQSKRSTHAVEPLRAPPLFRCHPEPRWVRRHHAALAVRLQQLRGDAEVEPPHFARADVARLPLESGAYDVVTCCGSVLSFVEDYVAALAGLSAALRPGGRMFLEVEQRLTPDTLWAVIDRLGGGWLGYEQTWREVAHVLFARPGRSVRLNYPFELHDGRTLTLPLWLFSVSELYRAFRACGLRVHDRLGVHQFTNLLPSVALHATVPSRVTRALFAPLRALDGQFARSWPFWRLGCSAVYCLEKEGS